MKTIKVPMPDGPEDRNIIPFKAWIGKERHNFGLQYCTQGRFEIVHYESGMLIKGLPVFFYAKGQARLWSVRSEKDWKEGAKLFLAALVEEKGADRVNAVINSAPRLNGVKS